MKILVTGGAGFIGSALIRHVIAERPADEVLNLDKLTYAGSLSSLRSVESNPRYHFVRGDIGERDSVARLLADFGPDVVMHLAAESHVDRSIDGPAAFVQTNVVGTFTLLDATLKYWEGLPAERRSSFRFHHVSTDEVFGSLGETGYFTEQTPYDPRSPYSASKAGSDHLVMAWHHTYGLPTVMTNCSNNYGPHQFPEKLIPLMIIKAMAGDMLPVYGNGSNVRDWLYVDDHVRALCSVFERGRLGETYNIGGNAERTNVAVVEAICLTLDRLRPRRGGGSYTEQIGFVEDRRGHDRRYAIDASKIRGELGWQPTQSFESGLNATVTWYLENEVWWRDLQASRYGGERLGLAK